MTELAHVSITCPRCQRTSHHPVDVDQRFSGWCRVWHDDLAELGARGKPNYLHCERCHAPMALGEDDCPKCGLGGQA